MSEPTRDELEQRATEAGVPNPERFPNKGALTEAIEGPNPARAPDPPAPPGERTYRVTGPRVVHDTAPGDTFTATLTVEHEASLLDAGHIQRIDKED